MTSSVSLRSFVICAVSRNFITIINNLVTAREMCQTILLCLVLLRLFMLSFTLLCSLRCITVDMYPFCITVIVNAYFWILCLLIICITVIVCAYFFIASIGSFCITVIVHDYMLLLRLFMLIFVLL